MPVGFVVDSDQCDKLAKFCKTHEGVGITGHIAVFNLEAAKAYVASGDVTDAGHARIAHQLATFFGDKWFAKSEKEADEVATKVIKSKKKAKTASEKTAKQPDPVKDKVSFE